MSARGMLVEGAARSASERDFFRSPAFCLAEGVTHSLVLLAGDDEFMSAPLIVREIPGTELRDGVSPYGYPGATPCDAADRPLPPVGEVDWTGTGLVSVFLRERVGTPSLAGATVRGELQVVDPREPLRLRQTHRRHVNRNHRLGYTTGSIHGPATEARERAAFVDLYRQTMAREGAPPRYLFPDEYFERILESESAWLLLTSDPDSRPAAGAIAVASDGMLHYYLGGTADELLRDSPLKSTIAALIEQAGGARLALNLGGGVRPGDGLEHFKRGFANSTAPFLTHEIVCDEAAYAELSAGREAGDFFPAYRVGGV